MNKNKSFQNITRSLHRDLGYFVIGLTLIYAFSGVVLAGRKLGWFEQEFITKLQVSKNIPLNDFETQIKKVLSKEELFEDTIPSYFIEKATTIKKLNLKEDNKQDNKDFVKYTSKNKIFLYDIKTGEVEYKFYSYPFLIKEFVSAHKANHERNWFYLSIFYSIVLAFLAISSIFMLKGKYGFRRRGVYLMLLGFLTVFIFLYI